MHSCYVVYLVNSKSNKAASWCAKKVWAAEPVQISLISLCGCCGDENKWPRACQMATNPRFFPRGTPLICALLIWCVYPPFFLPLNCTLSPPSSVHSLPTPDTYFATTCSFSVRIWFMHVKRNPSVSICFIHPAQSRRIASFLSHLTGWDVQAASTHAPKMNWPNVSWALLASPQNSHRMNEWTDGWKKCLPYWRTCDMPFDCDLTWTQRQLEILHVDIMAEACDVCWYSLCTSSHVCAPV